MASYVKRTNRFAPFDDSERANQYVSFTEFHFHGSESPPNDLGGLGDICIDTTEGSQRLFGKVTHGWELWKGPSAEHALIAHPEYPNRYLWAIRSVHLIGWVKPAMVKYRKGLRASTAEGEGAQETEGRSGKVLDPLSNDDGEAEDASTQVDESSEEGRAGH
ncbi:hypothetical protein C8J56DRAFT_398741 [Mycena floridula]|nr:hypothetical protein C8J56DRAFT_398741 [Mycena floridula]